MMYSEAYAKHLSRGPFPGRIDPWAEVGYYFHQIHPGLINSLIEQMQPTLLRMGYIIGREASLQIAAGREPDIYVQRTMDASLPEVRWDYGLAAAEILAEPGEVVEGDVDMQAIHIKQAGTGRLVTIVEIISPNNKTKPNTIADYRTRRERLLFEHGINIVEIDLTRSVKRLLTDTLTTSASYHYAIYLPHDSPRVIGIHYGETLKRMALPLRGEVIPLELQPAYDTTYQTPSIAALILNNDHYREDLLPFPTLLTEDQRRAAWEKVTTWKQELTRLRQG
jgi:Protein of unknown function (DUF4058)